MNMLTKTNVKRIIASGKSYLQRIASLIHPKSKIKYKRFLTDNPIAYQSAIEAAQSYPAKLGNDEHEWLYWKPFDPTPGNPQYYRLMFDLLNILQEMKLPLRARILEIGSGSGWVTEILATMGFSVDSLEPSADLVKIAEQRCASFAKHHHFPGNPDIRFHNNTLEMVEFPDKSFDAILYFDVLHHVVDEELAIRKSFQFLKPGGCIGVIDPSWHPSFKGLENQMIGEMAKYGTLENPFSTQYIDHLLKSAGFIKIERYVSVNGLFKAKDLSKSLAKFSPRPMAGSNNITARRPDEYFGFYPSCTNFNFSTNAQLKLISGGIDPKSRTAKLLVKLKNTGETLFDNRPDRIGHVTFSLRQDKPGMPTFIECVNRQPLNQLLIPGKSLTLELNFDLPSNTSTSNWELDMVSEAVFWFSARDIKACPIPTL